MLFNTFEYLAFFLVVTVLYYIMPGKIRYLWLLAASYFFYMNWNKLYALLLLASTAVTWGCGLLTERQKGHRGRQKACVAVCFLLNLGLLSYFKYGSFILENIRAVTGGHFDYGWNVLLPVGISFYIFQALGYTVDVYRGQIEAERNPFRYALFVSFFPQLVAGPIERSGNLLRQLRQVPEKVRPDYHGITGGLMMILWGLFLKMVIADRAAMIVDEVFDHFSLYGSLELAAAAILFSVQIYCDFAGYSTIAIGSAQVLGFTLTENFNTPFLSGSIREFWHRWHISLSNWFRDYLYIPMGGSRGSRPRKWFNLMVTMCVSGLWHGANWSFVVWGAIHGVYQIAEDMLAAPVRRLEDRLHTDRSSFSYKLGGILRTFILVTLAFIFFRADSLQAAVAYIGRMFTAFDPWVAFDGTGFLPGLEAGEAGILLFALAVLMLGELLQYVRGLRVDAFLQKQQIWFRWLCVFALFTMIWVWGIYGPSFSGSQFIYFQF